MENTFYNDLDRDFLEPTRTDYRTPFQQDRDRIIYSSAFRRLQAKTQVFFSGEYDFYRTRLTHSIEVAQIGRSICDYLRKHSPLFSDTFFVDADLVEAACLAHDLGHPPFGHAGERKLHRLMKQCGGFEGNAQTLRILTETMYPTPQGRKGMKPTRALMDSVLKYKNLYSQLDAPDNHFLYDEQKKYLHFVFCGETIDQHIPETAERNTFQSLECQIMEWADDTAYSLNDINDGLRAGFISRDKILAWAEKQTLSRKSARAWMTSLGHSLCKRRSVAELQSGGMHSGMRNPRTGQFHVSTHKSVPVRTGRRTNRRGDDQPYEAHCF